jgi:hypothetical protein
LQESIGYLTGFEISGMPEEECTKVRTNGVKLKADHRMMGYVI